MFASKHISLTAIAALALVPAAASAKHGGDRGVRVAGSCDHGVTSKLKLKNDDGVIEVEFEVDQNRVGKRWRVTFKRNGSTVFRSIRTTQAPSGSFEARRLLAGGAGTRIVATAKSLSSGETCRAAISF